MDANTLEIFDRILGLVQALCLPVLTALLFYSARKRKENAEAEIKELEADAKQVENISGFASEWRELYEKAEQKLEQKDAKIDRLYLEKEKDRQRMRQLTEENSDLKLKLQAAEFRKCDKRGCADREPPSGY
ncbi:hypothetical protein [uncultured Alistipes sp.]|uniref:hypothetical protein n=1 Tax=uncultured Alistipes sp. TaxID=538949 RepID=UPI0026197BE1|nr:hypothetical protein [uncultured Alistipes sp.]